MRALYFVISESVNANSIEKRPLIHQKGYRFPYIDNSALNNFNGYYRKDIAIRMAEKLQAENRAFRGTSGERKYYVLSLTADGIRIHHKCKEAQ